MSTGVRLNSRSDVELWAVVDDDDYPLVSQYNWHAFHCNRVTYARRAWRERTESGWKQRGQLMHNLIMGRIGIDHEDHNGLNNCRTNLRVATGQQNVRNSRPKRNSSSQYRGVSWDKAKGRWLAQISLGMFDDEEAAARAYDEMARQLGPFSYLNFPGGVTRAQS